MECLVIPFVLGIIPAIIAGMKGRNALLWWFYGFMLFIVALPHSLIIKPDQKLINQQKLNGGEYKQCPFCMEMIKSKAIICHFCGAKLTNISGNKK